MVVSWEAGQAAKDAETAIALIERSVALYRALGDDAQVFHGLCDLGRIARRDGKYAQSEAHFSEALELGRATHNEMMMSVVPAEMGALALNQQAPDRAISLLEESVRLLRELQFVMPGLTLGWALIHLAEARRVADDTRDGADGGALIRGLWQEGLALLRASQARVNVAGALLEIGEMVYEQGDNVCAAELLGESLVGLHELAVLQDQGHAIDAIAALWADGTRPGALRRAVQLWSAATKWHQNKPRASPTRRSRYERTFAAARSRLGEALFAAAWAEGQHLSLEQAVAYALSDEM